MDTFKPRLRVLSTGQQHCYDVAGAVVSCQGTGQDGEYRPGLPWPGDRFLTRNGVVLDRLTDLEWSRSANPAEWPMPLHEALRFITDLNERLYLGHNDWRVPGRAELRSLTSFADRNPALPAGHPFTDVYLSWYWTTTPSARNSEYAWYVHLEGARTFFGHRGEDHLVWPCRGHSRIVPMHGSFNVDAGARFLVRTPTVLDRATGLEWTRNANLLDGPARWEDALAAVRGLAPSLEGANSGWRLPTINELDSLVDLGRYQPALPAGHPFEAVGDAYWSSTSSAFEPDWAMALYFDLGRVGVGQKTGRSFFVWAVRHPSR